MIHVTRLTSQQNKKINKNVTLNLLVDDWCDALVDNSKEIIFSRNFREKEKRKVMGESMTILSK